MINREFIRKHLQDLARGSELLLCFLEHWRKTWFAPHFQDEVFEGRLPCCVAADEFFKGHRCDVDWWSLWSTPLPLSTWVNWSDQVDVDGSAGWLGVMHPRWVSIARDDDDRSCDYQGNSKYRFRSMLLWTNCLLGSSFSFCSRPSNQPNQYLDMTRHCRWGLPQRTPLL